jgi:hypothetical protein
MVALSKASADDKTIATTSADLLRSLEAAQRQAK